MRRALPAIIVLLTAAACSGAGSPDRSVGYIGQLNPIARDVNFSIASLGDTLDQTYESDLLRSTALADARIAQSLAIAQDRADRLEPTTSLAADHDRYLTFLVDAQGLAREFDAAVADGDLAAAALATVELEVAAGLSFIDLSIDVCASVSFERELCGFTDGTDVYRTALLEEMQRLTVAYLPWARPAPGAITGDDADRFAVEASRRAAERLDDATGSLAARNPPPDLAEDHQRLLDLLAEAAAIHRSGHDPSALICEGHAELSVGVEQFTSVLFLDDDLACEV